MYRKCGRFISKRLYVCLQIKRHQKPHFEEPSSFHMISHKREANPLSAPRMPYRFTLKHVNPMDCFFIQVINIIPLQYNILPLI